MEKKKKSLVLKGQSQNSRLWKCSNFHGFEEFLIVDCLSQTLRNISCFGLVCFVFYFFLFLFFFSSYRQMFGEDKGNIAGSHFQEHAVAIHKEMDLISGFSYSEPMICSILIISFMQGQQMTLINIQQYPCGMVDKTKTINNKPGVSKYLELFTHHLSHVKYNLIVLFLSFIPNLETRISRYPKASARK